MFPRNMVTFLIHQQRLLPFSGVAHGSSILLRVLTTLPVISQEESNMHDDVGHAVLLLKGENRSAHRPLGLKATE